MRAVWHPISPPCSEHCHNQVESDSRCYLSQMLHVLLLSVLDFSATRALDTRWGPLSCSRACGRRSYSGQLSASEWCPGTSEWVQLAENCEAHSQGSRGCPREEGAPVSYGCDSWIAHLRVIFPVSLFSVPRFRLWHYFSKETTCVSQSALWGSSGKVQAMERLNHPSYPFKWAFLLGLELVMMANKMKGCNALVSVFIKYSKCIKDFITKCIELTTNFNCPWVIYSLPLDWHKKFGQWNIFF